MDYFNNVLTMGLERDNCIAVYAESERISWN